MNTLIPPMPSSPVRFFAAVPPSIDIITLNCTRQAATQALEAVQQTPTKSQLATAVAALEAYRAAWMPFWHHVSNQQSPLHPVSFSWRHRIFGEEPVVTTESNPLFETVCIHISLAIVRTMHANVSLQQIAPDELIAPLVQARRWIAAHIVPVLHTTREPVLYSDSYLRALTFTVYAKMAWTTSLRGLHGDTATVVPAVFTAAIMLHSAKTALRGYPTLDDAHRTIASIAYRKLAQFFITEGKPAVGLLMAHEARAMHPGDAVTQAFAEKCEHENLYIHGGVKLPAGSKIRIVFVSEGDDCVYRKEEGVIQIRRTFASPHIMPLGRVK